MADFTLHDETSAPEGAREKLADAKKALGFIPSIYAVMAENPAVFEAYTTLSGIFSKAGLDPLEQQVVTITASVENECHFCVAAHSTFSASQKLDMDVIEAVREGRAIADPKLEALHRFSRHVVVERGFVSDAEVDALLEAGYTKAAVLGVILGVSLKVLSNYTNHVAETPVNPQFQAFEWTPPTKRCDQVA